MKQEVIADGARQQAFEFSVNDEVIGGVLWMPHTIHRPLPLLLAAHGGGQHKLFPPLAANARVFARELHCAVVSIDAPAHGDRVVPQQTALMLEKIRSQMRQPGQGVSDEALDYMLDAASRAAQEWPTVIDLMRSFDGIDPTGKVSFLGLSQGAMTGVLLAASEPRITAAVFGLAGMRDKARMLEQAASAITIPLQFVIQWNDELIPREHALALFDAFASPEKSLHAHPGAHASVPPFERASWKAFFRRHLGTGVN